MVHSMNLITCLQQLHLRVYFFSEQRAHFRVEHARVLAFERYGCAIRLIIAIPVVRFIMSHFNSSLFRLLLRLRVYLIEKIALYPHFNRVSLHRIIR